ncbi:leucyl aminopeptidase [Agromyces albus]|uniref:Probable cytosol aminopeptidase n=1 Tax=Agromyces albus TaxID=205332 RepID=A0A4V1QY43_9MICO|nr:leucyl aminopeptidase [Agromyces albus]RXZ71856.1 leucyl aminopeptidase [Agromyces albus]
MIRSPNKLIRDDFTATPSLHTSAQVAVVRELDEATLDAIGVLVTSDGALPADVDLDRAALERVGFEAKPGSTLVLPTATGPLLVLVGLGAATEVDVAALRNAAAAFTRATARSARIGLRASSLGDTDAATAAQALTEGALLARYRFDALRRTPRDVPLSRVELVLDDADVEQAAAGADTGLVTARAASIARDLANSPPGHLTATEMADVAVDLGARFGFDVEVYDKQQLIELGCGGLLGVNQGSTEEPRMVRLRYTPPGEPTGHLGLVGKGIMYDSGGISLKPSDPMHLLMKMDMGGAASVLATFTALRALGASATVSGWLMCTDNMPSGSAYKLGDVLTAFGGTTVEVRNTDAEGRLVMMDAIVLANEAGVDAIVDIATLTGASLMALGQLTAALFGNDDTLIATVERAAAVTDEQVWRLPLERKYRKQLDSEIADIANLGGPYAGATTAALFLHHFVGETPWAHLDIAGTMQADSDDLWRSKGATGFGTRILIEVARQFQLAR